MRSAMSRRNGHYLRQPIAMLPSSAPVGNVDDSYHYSEMRMHTTKTNPITEFGILLYSVACRLSKAQTKSVVYLIQDIISHSEAERIEDSVQALNLLRERNCIHYARPEFLCTILRDVGRDDLCQLVEDYRQSLAPIQPFIRQSSGECDRRISEEQFREKYSRRVGLKRLADQLTRSDLQSMLVMSKDLIPVSHQEKVDSPLDLLRALEEYGFLSPKDTSILGILLEHKQHLLEYLKPIASTSGSEMAAQFSSTTTQYHTQPNTKPCVSKYQSLLRHVGESLSCQEVEHLKTLQPLCTLATGSAVTGTQLMLHWEQLGLVSALEIGFLCKVLHTIGRQSLCQEVAIYSRHSVQSNPGGQANQSSSDLHGIRTTMERQFSCLSGQLSSIKKCKPDLENHPLHSSNKQHTQDFVVDAKDSDLNGETQADDVNSHPLIRKLLLENASLTRKLIDTKQCMMDYGTYFYIMHSKLQEMNRELVDEMLSIKKELEEFRGTRCYKQHCTMKCSNEAVVSCSHRLAQVSFV